MSLSVRVRPAAAPHSKSVGDGCVPLQDRRPDRTRLGPLRQQRLAALGESLERPDAGKHGVDYLLYALSVDGLVRPTENPCIEVA